MGSEKEGKGKSPFKIGEEFVDDVIKEIPNIVNVIKEYISLGNKFDLILTFPKKNNVISVVKGDTRVARKLIEEAEGIIIIECSRRGRFKHIKENFGEILKIPALNDDVIQKIKAFYLVHEKIENPKYKDYFERLSKLLFNPIFKVELIELKDINDKIAKLVASKP